MPGYKLQHYRATIAYDGTDFLGFQLQATGRTVQGVLEEALLGLGGAETRVVGSGRTDAGVHAVGQVVGFRMSWRHTTAGLHRALNAVLPQDIAVSGLTEAPDEWHPRFSARWRHYRYTVLNAAWRDPLTRRYALHMPTPPGGAPLQLEQLQAAARILVGEHDFASFGRPMQDGAPGEPGTSTIRAIFASNWRQDGSTFTYDVIGNAFLRGMVRSLVGSMLQVGLGKWPAERLAEVLAAPPPPQVAPPPVVARDRSSARPAAACGLCLMHVEYD